LNNNYLYFEDFISGPYNVTFFAGITRVPFDIALHNDNVTEGRETFNLMISDDIHPNISLGNIHQVMLSIVDNASKLFL